MNDEILVILKELEWLQSKGERFFPAGLFPSFRSNKFLFYKRPDTNIFYTANIVFILQSLKPYLLEKHNSVIDNIMPLAIRNYPDFQNKDGLKTYNFWATKPSNHFPNGRIFKHFEHFRIPDDIDDTALIYLTKPHLREDALWLKEKASLHANLEKLQIKNTFQHYRNLGVYSTWFGKNMPIEFDACALCNLMYLFEKHQLPHNENDVDTYRFLREVIMRKEYITAPFRVSHNYATTPLIIYHYARLLGDFKIEPLEDCRKPLINCVLKLWEDEKSEMNKIILETSLIKLGGSNKDLNNRIGANQYSLNVAQQQFTYFIAGLLSSYENPISHWLAPLKITQMQWQCQAHCLTLLLENKVLHNKKGFE